MPLLFCYVLQCVTVRRSTMYCAMYRIGSICGEVERLERSTSLARGRIDGVLRYSRRICDGCRLNRHSVPATILVYLTGRCRADASCVLKLASGGSLPGCARGWVNGLFIPGVFFKVFVALICYVLQCLSECVRVGCCFCLDGTLVWNRLGFSGWSSAHVYNSLCAYTGGGARFVVGAVV